MFRASRCWCGITPSCIQKHHYRRRLHLEKTPATIAPMARATRAPTKICFRVNPPWTWRTWRNKAAVRIAATRIKKRYLARNCVGSIGHFPFAFSPRLDRRMSGDSHIDRLRPIVARVPDFESQLNANLDALRIYTGSHEIGEMQ